MSGLLVKAAQKIKFLHKYIASLKQEVEETAEKYDRLAIKYRDLIKENKQTKDLYEVAMAQKQNS